MNKNLSKIYTIVVLIALVLLGAWSAWDVYQLRSNNTEAAQINIETIKKTVEDSYNSGTPFNDNDFFNTIRSLFSENQELELLTIYSHDTGIEYYYNRGEEVTLLNQDDENPLSWESLPEYNYNQLMKTKLNRNLQASNRTGLDMDLIYQVVDRAEIYNILIRVLIVVIVLFFFTTLFMIFAVSRRKDVVVESDEKDDFVSSDSDEDDMSLDWDDNKADEDFALPSMDEGDIDFGEMDLNDSGGDFDDLNLDDASDDFGDLNLDDTSDDLGDLNLDDATDDFGDLNLDDTSDDLGDLNLDDASDDFGDLNLDDASDDFGDLNLDDTSDDLGDLNLDDASDDFGDLNLDDTSDDLGDLNLDDASDDFGDLNLDDASDDFGDLNLSGDDDIDSDISFDDIETDVPEEEDLMAMDHEVSPTTEMDDFDFDDMGDTFAEDKPESDIEAPASTPVWNGFIEEKVNLELEKAASSDQDLVMGMLQCESINEENYSDFADHLKEEFDYPDITFEYKKEGLAVIVPNSDLDNILQVLESFTGKEKDQYGEINVGISSRNGRLITGNRIFMEAENALHKAVEDSEKNIVGFRSDPDKFKDYLSSK